MTKKVLKKFGNKTFYVLYLSHKRKQKAHKYGNRK